MDIINSVVHYQGQASNILKDILHGRELAAKLHTVIC